MFLFVNIEIILDFSEDFILKEDLTDQIRCPECDQCVNEFIMPHHMYAAHEELAKTTGYEDPFVENKNFCRCLVCDDIINMFSLRRHLLLKHQIKVSRSTKITKVPIKLTSFSKKNLLKKFFPDIDKTKKTVVECPLCQKEVHIKKFNRHFQKSHGIKCALCNINFGTYPQKILHMAKVHKLTKAQEIANRKTKKCHICGQLFLRPNEVRNHIEAVHKRQRNFLCDLCGAAFLRKSALKGHRARHFNLKLYKCKLCLKRYGEVSALKKHLKSIHDLIPEGRWNSPFVDRDSLPWIKLTEKEGKDLQETEKKVGKIEHNLVADGDQNITTEFFFDQSLTLL